MKRLISVVLAVIMVMAMSSSVFAAGTTAKTAEKTALKNAGLSKSQVTGLRTKYDRDDRRFEVDLRRKSNNAKYSYEISPTNGKIYEKSIDYRYKRNSSKKKISKAAAIRAAAKASNININVVKKGICKYEYDDGEGIYEVKFRNGLFKFDIDILAPTGKVIEYSWERTGR